MWTSPVDDADPLGTAFGAQAIRHLRESGRYLLPGGGGDALRLAIMAFRNWVAVQMVIGMSLLTLFLCGKTAQAALVEWKVLDPFQAWIAADGWPAWLWPVEWLQGYPTETLILSSLWPIVVLCLCVAIALSWGYWLARLENIQELRVLRILGGAGLGTVGIVALCYWLAAHSESPGVWLGIAVLGSGGLLSYLAAEWVDYLRMGSGYANATSALREQEDRVRNRLTGWATKVVMTASIAGLLALVDTFGQSAYEYLRQPTSSSLGLPLSISAAIAAATPVLQRILATVQRLGSVPVLLRRFGRWIATLVGLLLVLAIVTLWAIAADYIAWRGEPIGFVGPAIFPITPLGSLAITASIAVAVATCIGLSFGFLNISSFSGFYAGRLRRAYLGASNPHRVSSQKPSNRDDPGDDIAPPDYYAMGSGAPLHLINVTIAETHGKGSPLVQRDRKGRPMTLSPAGYLVPTIGEKRVRIGFETDPAAQGVAAASPPRRTGSDLPLSTWVAISGAAFSTALGSYTSMGFSLLAGLANLRLGYWWEPFPQNAARRPSQWTQRYLVREFLARFGGIFHHRWYLTDGGHFENTGVYELVRRRVPLIVACDNAADPDYDFGDIMNLTRKLRIDFDAELEFLPRAELDKLLGVGTPVRSVFGELSDLVRFHAGSSSRGPYAALARITVPDRPGKPAYIGTMILIKPRLGGLELADLLDYNRIDATFPQQTTRDQFFDEAQWESYYRLGMMIADLVFAPPAKGQCWAPASLVAVDTERATWVDKEWVPQPRIAKVERAAPLPTQPTVCWSRMKSLWPRKRG
ncbi:hypothetical protein ASE91_03970 [Sphingomonas sp. Leaf62]|nr:hypothetical protein ASE91_03970 [Sphingomonas sp. Leaf62]